jgi:hypothetical protein
MSAQPGDDHSMVPQAAAANLFSAIMRGIPSAREIVYLVPKDGEKIPIQENVLKENSDFFKATLESRMQESGEYQGSLFVGDSQCLQTLLCWECMCARLPPKKS